jgi:acyl-CoA thioester hydrolase
MARADFSFFHTLRVRWSEVDMQKVVFNGNYFNYFDVAVFESWRAMVNLGVKSQGTGLKTQFEQWVHNIYAVKTSAEYHAPAHWDDELQIGVRVAKFGRSSMRTVTEIHRADDHLITGELIYVYKDPVLNASAPWPDAFKQMVAGFEKVRPEGA